MFKDYLNRGWIVILLIATSANMAMAQSETNWLGGGGDWQDAANWSDGVPSDPTTSAFISRNGHAKIEGPFSTSLRFVLLGFTEPGTPAETGGLTIGGTPSTTAVLSTVDMAVGYEGQGTLLIQPDGEVRVSNIFTFNTGLVEVDGGRLALAYYEDGFASTLNVHSGGHFSIGGNTVELGRYGVTEFNITGPGSTATFHNSPLATLSIGSNEYHSLGARGSLTIADQATLLVRGSIHLERGGELSFGNGGLAGSLDTNSVRNDGLIRLAHTGTLDLDTLITGTGTIQSVGTGSTTLTNIEEFRGTIRADQGEINITGAVDNPVTLRASSGAAINYRNANLNGGFLRGSGIHRLETGATNELSGVTSFNSTVIDQAGTATLRNFSNGGTLNNRFDLQLDGFANSSSGIMELKSTVDAIDLTNMGVMNVRAGSTLTISEGNLIAGGGSRTLLDEGGEIDLLGSNRFELNGGLLVNNGTLNGTLAVNYGGLAKGVGAFGDVIVNDGGVFSPGNSPGLVWVDNLELNSGSELVFEIRDMLGVAGEGFDQIHATGEIGFNSGTTDLSALTILIASLGADNLSGLADNFDFSQSFSYEFLIADGGLSGFDASRLRLDTSGFLNAANSERFSISTRGNSVFVNFSSVPEPSGLGILLLLLTVTQFRRTRSTVPR